MPNPSTETQINVEAARPPDFTTTLLAKVDAGATAIVFVAAAILWLTRGQLKRIVDSYCETNDRMAKTLTELHSWGREEREYRESNKDTIARALQSLERHYSQTSEYHEQVNQKLTYLIDTEKRRQEPPRRRPW